MSKPLSAEETNERRKVIAEQYDGIIPYHEALYIQSIMYSAASSAGAFARFDHAVAQGDGVAALLSIQEALTHGAAVSRYFWPSKDKRHYLKRAEKLKKAFDVDETSPLIARGLRNAMEHFDERLDDFLVGGATGPIIPGPIVGDHRIADDPSGSVFRLVDPAAQIFIVFAEKHDFSGIRHEVDRILALARAFDEKGGRLRKKRP